MNTQIVKWIKIVVMRTLREKGLTKLDVSTLISAGMLGYAQSLKRFDPDRGVKFKTFAEHRIRGAVLDEVRKMIGDERCKTPRPRRVDDIDLTIFGDDSNQKSFIESSIALSQFFNAIPLDDREKQILQCRILGMNLREISQEFGFSESRASQLLAKIKKEVYIYYRGQMNLKFKLVSHICPDCHGENVVAESADDFKCEVCDAELKVVDGVPILALTEGIGDEFVQRVRGLEQNS